MRIERGKVVTLEYELRDCDGDPLESDSASMAYLHGGFGGIFPKVEAELEGKDIGHEMTIKREPEDAFGEYDAELSRVGARNRSPPEREAGMDWGGAPGDTGDEQSAEAGIYSGPDITADSVVVDAN